MNPNDPFMIIQDYPSSNILNDIRFLNWHFSIENSQKNKKLRNCKDYADHISSTGIRFHLYAHVFPMKVDLQPNPISGFVIFILKIQFFRKFHYEDSDQF